jgi:mannose-1-phosphate guanylyltransferase/mannose-6-phosphate isomerase
MKNSSARSQDESGSEMDAAAVPSSLRIAMAVLAGGSGTRLWPVSREQYPEELVSVLGTDSLLQATVLRMRGFSGEWEVASAPIVVCGAEHCFSTAEQLRAIGVNARLVVEPARRDTAPALTLAASAIFAGGEDAIIVAMPADHAIADVEAFHRALAPAVRQAENGAIVTLGVPPTRAETGVGYIRVGAALEKGVHLIERFVEKPAEQLATQYVESGNYWWNSGIFVVRATVWLDTLKKLQPSMHDACVAAIAHGTGDGASFRPGTQFEQSPSISIDRAVMEKLGTDETLAPGVVVSLEAGWSDLGSWDAVWDGLDKDVDGNVARGRVVLDDTASSFVHSEARLVTCIGLTNVVVVETDDAVLVADRSRVQDLKRLVARLGEHRAPEASAHRKVRRSWGYYDSIDQGDRFLVRSIVVQPGGRLSLQVHYHRTEHWIVVRGTALVVRDGEQFLLTENESTFIPLGVRHRLENPGKIPLQMIEVQSGSYLSEDDIVRFDNTADRV